MEASFVAGLGSFSKPESARLANGIVERVDGVNQEEHVERKKAWKDWIGAAYFNETVEAHAASR
eukprot:4102146-Pyramimonas_sp.AAC.1